MDYDDLIRKSIKTFINGKMPEATAGLHEGGLRYTPEYFDQLEKDLDEGPVAEAEDTDDEKDTVDGI